MGDAELQEPYLYRLEDKIFLVVEELRKSLRKIRNSEATPSELEANRLQFQKLQQQLKTLIDEHRAISPCQQPCATDPIAYAECALAIYKACDTLHEIRLANSSPSLSSN